MLWKADRVTAPDKARPDSDRDMTRPVPDSLDEIARRVVEVADPEQIILFGSAARGTAGSDSDVDLLVIKAVAHRRRLAQAIYRRLLGAGYAVDVVVATPDDVERYRNVAGLVIKRALTEGKLIYSRGMHVDRCPPDDPREWLNRARSSLVRAREGGIFPEIYLEDLCFDAQQAAERASKAVLLHLGLEFPPVHDLAQLLTLVERAGHTIPDDVRPAAALSDYAVVTRYAGPFEPVTREEYEQALAIATAVDRWARAIIFPPSP
jgi:HEPN domain-containing protein/predicted nucleotidyltransferase